MLKVMAQFLKLRPHRLLLIASAADLAATFAGQPANLARLLFQPPTDSAFRGLIAEVREGWDDLSG